MQRLATIYENLDFFRDNVKCCISGKPLNDSEEINFILLDYKATWKAPVWGDHNLNFDNMAIAVVDSGFILAAQIISSEGKRIFDSIKYAIEITDDKQVIYHHVSDLKKLSRPVKPDLN